MQGEQERRLGKYRLLSKIGGGSFGTVWLAEDTTTSGMHVALKVLLPQWIEDPKVLGLFEREIRVAHRLNNGPHIVIVYDAGECEGQRYIAMELLRGPTLGQALEREGKLPLEQVVGWLEQAAEAIDYAHAEGIVHGDLKPNNMVLDDKGEVRVVDFGLARAVEASGGTSLQNDSGTALYMAPEQADGKLTALSDVYALGISAYQLFTGTVPFKQGNRTAILLAHQMKPPPPPCQLRLDLPREIEGVILRALEKAPQSRYGSAGQFATALRWAYVQGGVLPKLRERMKECADRADWECAIEAAEQILSRCPEDGEAASIRQQAAASRDAEGRLASLHGQLLDAGGLGDHEAVIRLADAIFREAPRGYRDTTQRRQMAVEAQKRCAKAAGEIRELAGRDAAKARYLLEQFRSEWPNHPVVPELERRVKVAELTARVHEILDLARDPAELGEVERLLGELQELGSEGLRAAEPLRDRIRLRRLVLRAENYIAGRMWPEALTAAGDMEAPAFGKPGRRAAALIRRRVSEGQHVELDGLMQRARVLLEAGDWPGATALLGRLGMLGKPGRRAATKVQGWIRDGWLEETKRRASKALSKKNWTAALALADELARRGFPLRAVSIRTRVWWGRNSRAGWLRGSALAAVVLALAGIAYSVLPCPWRPGCPPPPTDSPTLPPTHALTPTLMPGVAPLPTPTPTWFVRDKDFMEMVEVSAGNFPMGSNASDPGAEANETPQHSVYLDSFWIDKYEVSNWQYKKCVDAGFCSAPPTKCGVLPPTFGEPTKHFHPVTCVTWTEANAYCDWAGARLPTEAEWEKAASWDDEASHKRVYPAGDGAICGLFNASDAMTPYNPDSGCETDPFPTTAPVGAYPGDLSPCGAQDMAGNVMEWVSDFYSASYYESSPETNALGPATGEERVLRGGCWLLPKEDCRGAARALAKPETRMAHYGFRCARPSAPEPPAPEAVVTEYFARLQQAGATQVLTPLLDLFADDAAVTIPAWERKATGAVPIQALYRDLCDRYSKSLGGLPSEVRADGEVVLADLEMAPGQAGVLAIIPHAFGINAGKIQSLIMDLPAP